MKTRRRGMWPPILSADGCRERINHAVIGEVAHTTRGRHRAMSEPCSARVAALVPRFQNSNHFERSGPMEEASVLILKFPENREFNREFFRIRPFLFFVSNGSNK